MITSKKLIFLIFLLISSPLFGQTTWYVSSSGGSNSNSGRTESAPFKTISHIGVGGSANIQEGDIILFKRGDIFPVDRYKPQADNIFHGAYGSGAKPIWDGEETSRYLVYIPSQNEGSSDIDGFTFSNIRFIDCEHNGGIGSETDYETNLIYMEYCDDVLFDGCEFDGNYNAYSLVYSGWGDNITFTHCHFEESGVQHGVYLKNKSDYISIMYCTFEDIGDPLSDSGPAPIKFNTGDVPSGTTAYQPVVMYNTFTDCRIVIQDANSEELLCAYNTAYTSLKSAPGQTSVYWTRIRGDKGYSTTPIGQQIFNNTMVFDMAGSSLSPCFIYLEPGGIGGSNDGDGAVIKNNIVYFVGGSGKEYAFWRRDNNTASITMDNNLYYNTSGNVEWFDQEAGWNYTSLNSYQSGQNKEPNSIQDNPDFTNVTGGTDLTLSSSSPAIDQGANFTDHKGNPIDTDLAGNRVPYNSNIDLGAYEFVQTGSAPNANFNVSKSNPAPNEIVTFSDGSTNSPTEWEWSFSPNDIEFEEGTSSASKNPKVSFKSGSTYSCTLKVSNSFGTDEIVKPNLINVVIDNPDPGILLNVKVILSGCYNSDTQIMHTLLNSNGFIPSQQPYNDSLWNYDGNEIASELNDDVVDWILIELRKKLAPSSRIAIKAVLLNSDGSVSETNGNSVISFPSVVPDDYYILIHHRNHLSVMSAFKQSLTNNSILYDFTSSQVNAYGSGTLSDLGDGKYGLFSGDGNANGLVSEEDIQNFWIPQFLNSIDGYQQGDFDLDGSVTASDNNVFWLPNINKSIPFQK